MCPCFPVYPLNVSPATRSLLSCVADRYVNDMSSSLIPCFCDDTNSSLLTPPQQTWCYAPIFASRSHSCDWYVTPGNEWVQHCDRLLLQAAVEDMRYMRRLCGAFEHRVDTFSSHLSSPETETNLYDRVAARTRCTCFPGLLRPLICVRWLNVSGWR